MGASFLAQNGQALDHAQAKSSKAGGVQAARRRVGRRGGEFPPGVMGGWELGYAAGREANLIYCAISGFGQNGPLKLNPPMTRSSEGCAG